MTRSPSTIALFSGLCLLASSCLTGCQTAPGSNPLPSANYLDGQVQYFPTGSKFKLTQEAAAMKAYHEQQNNQQYADDQTRPTIDMQPYAQPANHGVMVSAD